MACNCASEIAMQAVEQQPLPGKRIVAAQIQRSLRIIQKDGKSTLSAFTYSNMELTVEGEEEETTMPVIHKFCPWCGQEK
ncbi:hypothetical protein EFA69_16210 [Rufibacter immobilis]|uniref:Uncharacterized protein n=1 Tax=Rufibacter immobilis TaxID=1348778 RepID=A0A3M9MQ90_9BACT|nr:hypothetical protein EFA69_16210 [Rufibacter immobilis]